MGKKGAGVLKRLMIIALVVGALAAPHFVWADEPSSVFPLGRSLAGDRKLPRTFGIGVAAFAQREDYELVSLHTNLPGVSLAQAAGLDIESETYGAMVKLDMWVFPFLNVFGVIGKMDGETDLDLGPPFGKVEWKYDGLIYGGGCTLAFGIKQFFGSLTALYTQTDLDPPTSSVEALIAMPRVGMKLDNLSFWVGAMYQDVEQRHKGKITLPTLGTVNFDVELEQAEHWNFLAGIAYMLGEHWNLELEGGFGDRTMGTLGITYRF
jgi:hypothetical protein